MKLTKSLWELSFGHYESWWWRSIGETRRIQICRSSLLTYSGGWKREYNASAFRGQKKHSLFDKHLESLLESLESHVNQGSTHRQTKQKQQQIAFLEDGMECCSADVLGLLTNQQTKYLRRNKRNFTIFNSILSYILSLSLLRSHVLHLFFVRSRF